MVIVESGYTDREVKNMKAIRLPSTLVLMLFAVSCVTINVYFPAAAAEKAADRIIKDVYGESPAPASTPEPASRYIEPGMSASRMAGGVLYWLITPAEAAADFSIKTPAIQKIEANMASRHRQLEPYYASGAVGMTRDGLITVRDQKAIPLQERKQVSQIVAGENQDRNALYAEIARANGHPEWEKDVRQTFARRWVANAPSGWWYMDESGKWKRK
jgi:uncharacterized protein YdbL (DUF1318 family)